MSSPTSSRGDVVVPPLPFTLRPLGVRIAVVGLLLGLAGVCAAVWIGFGPEVRSQFTAFQIGTLLLLGLMAFSTGHALARSRVDVRESGIKVVNGYRAREIEWGDVAAVRMRRGAPWASLEQTDGTVVSLLGIQQTDGNRAEESVLQLRAAARAGRRRT